MTTFNAAPNADVAITLHALNDRAVNLLVSQLGSWFVSHDSIDRERLIVLAAEAEAVCKPREVVEATPKSLLADMSNAIEAARAERRSS